MNFLKFLENFGKFPIDQASFNPKIINEIIGVLWFYIFNQQNLKEIIIEKNFLASFIKIESLTCNKIDFKEGLYLDAIFKFLETMAFDPEFGYFNICNKILDYFYENQSFKKNIPLKSFTSNFSSLYYENPNAFEKAFSIICFIKMDKNNNLVIKLKKGQFN